MGIIVLYGVQWMYGFVVFFYLGVCPSLRRESLSWHVLFGMFVYVLVVTNVAVGFLEKFTFMEIGGKDKYGSEAYFVNFTAITTILYGTFVLLTVCASNDQEIVDQSYLIVDSTYSLPS